MLKEAAGVAGGAILLPPLGVSVVACGLPGLLVAGAGMLLVDTMMKQNLATRGPVPDGETSSPEAADAGFGTNWQKLG